MTRPLALRLLTAGLLGALLPAVAAAAPPRPEKAKITAVLADRTAYEPGATARVAARVTIDSGWHVNSHQPTFDYLIPTELSLELPAGWPKEAVTYPPAKKQTFAFA